LPVIFTQIGLGLGLEIVIVHGFFEGALTITKPEKPKPPWVAERDPSSPSTMSPEFPTGQFVVAWQPVF